MLVRLLGDENPGVRREAVRIVQEAEYLVPQAFSRLMRMTHDADPQVRLQLAYRLGNLEDPASAEVAAEFALRERNEPLIVAALFSSLNKSEASMFFEGLLAATSSPPSNLVDPIVAFVAQAGDDEMVRAFVERLTSPRDGRHETWQWSGLATLLEANRRRTPSAGEPSTRYESIGKMTAEARTISADAKTDAGVRVQAIRVLGYSKTDRDADLKILASLLAPQTPSDVQTAAVVALGRMRDDRAGAVLLEAWSGLGPGVRRTVLDVLFSREASVALLLMAIDEKRIAARDVDATYRERLLKSKNEAIRERAAKAFAGAIDADRAKVVAQFQGVSNLAGDVSLGKAMFEKRCAVCHQVGGVGHAVGPDLTALSDNSPASLLVAVLDPNRAIEAKFHTYLAVTDDGLSYTGILVNETGNSITLLGQEAKQQVVLRANLETLTSTGKSLMPEGLEKELTEQDLANVFAFVRAAKKK
jgi:putative heme-binding domain-containing protein